MKLQAADGTAVTITPAHTVTFTFIKSSTMIKTTITGTDAPKLKTSSMVVITWSGTRFSGTLGDEAGVAQVAGPGGDLAAGRTYRFGSMRVRAGAAQTDLIAGISLSNRVRLHDEYLYGIGEVSSSWPAAALRAQVIAARSYVYNDVYNSDGTTRPRRSACDCQVYGDIRDQNYVGWQKISSVKGDMWKAAVDATLVSDTTGLVVKSGNSVVQTFFAAANGGATQNNEDVWGGSPRSYLRSVDDPWTLMPAEAITVSAWSPRVRTQQVVAAAFGLPNVATLDLSDRFVSGALKSVTATSTTGQTATISGEKFRSTMVSDTGSSLMSTWVWRSIVTPVSAAAPGLSEEFIRHRFFGFCKAPGSTAKSAVIVSAAGESGPATMAAAASYAAVKGAALIVAKASGDVVRIKALLTAQAITSVVTVGVVDAAITSALTTAKISWRNIQGATLSDLSRRLATDANAPADKGIVIASASEPSAWPLAVSVSARMGRPLLYATEKTLTADVVSWISSASPASIYVVGSTTELPDSALAGFADVSRITTSDLPLASLTLLGRGDVAVRGVILMAGTSDPLKGVLAALSGLPIVYEDATTTATVLDWLRRQSLAAAVVDLGVTPEFLQQVRRA
jgi:SpoIID/LytB domain protein